MSTVLRSRNLLEWPALAWLPLVGPSIRIEEFREGNEYIVRAELPGIDPAKDVHVSVVDASLRIRVERLDEHKDKGRSEFHYGEFYRTVPLPLSARQDSVKATYDQGILEIKVRVGEFPEDGREIPVAIGNGHGTGNATGDGQASPPPAGKATKKA